MSVFPYSGKSDQAEVDCSMRKYVPAIWLPYNMIKFFYANSFIKEV